MVNKETQIYYLNTEAFKDMQTQITRNMFYFISEINIYVNLWTKSSLCQVKKDEKYDVYCLERVSQKNGLFFSSSY